MKTYNVKITDTAAIDWESIDKAMIDSYSPVWGGDYKPCSYAQVVYAATGKEDEGLYLHLVSHESNPYAIYTKHNDPVFLDSCLEAFFTMRDPDAPANGYINIESNSNPTTLIAYGFDRNSRTPIVDLGIEPFAVTGKKSADKWELLEFVPIAVLKRVFKLSCVDENTVMGANFYKCGGDHEVQPYGSWAPVDTPAPNFHCPEFFGELKLVR